MSLEQPAKFPPRRPWPVDFPPVAIHADESRVKQHPAYPAAKSGDADAALLLVQDTLALSAVESLRGLLGTARPVLVSAHALEQVGVNAIPEALADELGQLLDLPVDSSVVQTNVVSHTGADGFSRLARQAAFAGDILPGADYVLVDDFVGQGGTLANLRGFILHHGGRVVGAITLTGRGDSAKLALTAETLELLRNKHGRQAEIWWIETFGYDFSCLTESEGRYLLRVENADTIRARISAARSEIHD